MKTTVLSVRCPVEYAEAIQRMAARLQITAAEMHLRLIADATKLPRHKPRPVGRPPRKGK